MASFTDTNNVSTAADYAPVGDDIVGYNSSAYTYNSSVLTYTGWDTSKTFPIPDFVDQTT